MITSCADDPHAPACAHRLCVAASRIGSWSVLRPFYLFYIHTPLPQPPVRLSAPRANAQQLARQASARHATLATPGPAAPAAPLAPHHTRPGRQYLATLPRAALSLLTVSHTAFLATTVRSYASHLNSSWIDALALD